jgi:hypothetical protein
MPETVWVIAALSFIVGGVAMWLYERARDGALRPRLAAQVSDELGSLVETDVTLLVEAEPGKIQRIPLKQKHARLIVRNKGRGMAYNCEASIYVVRRTNGPSGNYVFQSDLLDLTWSHTGRIVNNIPAGGYKILDLCRSQITKEAFDKGEHASTSFSIASPNVPARLVEQLKMGATYEFQILISADNAKPVRCKCQVRAGQTWSDLQISAGR